MSYLCHLVSIFILIIVIFHDGASYYIETSSLTWGVDQWTGFYMIEPSVMKEMKHTCQFAH